MSGIGLFHFLRPEWLLLLPLLGFAWWRVRRRVTRHEAEGELVAPHLRDALTVNEAGSRGFLPVDGAGLSALLFALAAAGPTWSKAPSPWFAETAPLVIAIEVTDSMRANDLPPTRLDRARFKVLDLIRARTGSRTAIIAYAGSAHVVVPPSTDPAVIEPLLNSLDPVIMPVTGSRPASVLAPALQMLGDDAALGTLLFVNDGFDAMDIEPLAEFSAQAGAPAVAALVVGTDAGGVALLPDGSPVRLEGGGRIDTRVDAAVLRRIGSEADVAVVRASAGDDADIRRLLGAIASNLAQADDPDAQWVDGGWWLFWPAALATLLAFRRGWTTAW